MRLKEVAISVSLCVAAANFAAGQTTSDAEARFARGVQALKKGFLREAHPDILAGYEARSIFDAKDERRCVAAFAMASLSFQEGDLPNAEKHYTEATCGSTGSMLAAMSWNGLGEVYLDEARVPEAEAVLEKAIAYFNSQSPVPIVAFQSRRHLAEARLMRGDFASGEQMLKALADDERRQPPDQQLAGAMTLSDLGRLYIQEDRFNQAEEALRSAVEISRQLGENHPTYADAIVSLATLYRVRRQTERAEPLLRKARKIYESAGDPKVMTVLTELGACALLDHKYMTAKQDFETALEISRRIYGPDHVVAARLETDVAAVAIIQGDSKTAQSLLEHARQVVSQAFGAASSDLARINDVAKSLNPGPLSARK
ncbi:MAG TPA: tetratricopeptide repeat protein [Bryobacteraceae bacterium]|nr:tetratricopeptide repeat protein [Bryobacteraceae bacterium]